MAGKKLDLHSNGTKESLVTNENVGKPVRLWKQIHMNEWTLIFLLFLMSLSIVLGKLYTNYGLEFLQNFTSRDVPSAVSKVQQGNILQRQNSSKYTVQTSSVFSNMSDLFAMSRIPDVSNFNVATMSKKFANISSQYDDVVFNTMTLFFQTYGWLMRAAICGLIMMGFTWFIIYKDSSIPGINPPSPLSPSKRRFSNASGVQMNYLVGVLNGILIFVYMCL